MDSTADDVNEATPALTSTMKEAKTAEVVVRDDAISSTTADKYIENLDTSTHNLGTDSDAEADFLEAELSISNIASEKITENVEDIVQDLENLLGGSSEYFGRDTSVQLQTGQNENENGRELVSSQEVTSANVPLSDVVEQLKQVECINKVETTPINKLNEKESVEIHIVDSTVNSKTDSWCNVDESSATNTFLFEVDFKPDEPHVECKSEDSVNTAVSQTTIPDLPVFEETLNCDWNSVEKSNEANQNVYKTDRTTDGVLNQQTVAENEKLQFGHESTEVTTSQCATEESIAPVEMPHDTNQVETMLVTEGTEQLNLTKVVDGTINQEQDTELSDDKSLEAPTNTNTIPTTECVNQADILDAKIFSVDADLVEDEKPTTSTAVNIPQVSSEAETESLAVNEVANPAEIDDAQIPQFTSEELPHSEDVNLTMPQHEDHVKPLCSQEEMLEDINQMKVADTGKKDLLVNEENKNSKVSEDEVVVNTDMHQNVNEEKVKCFSDALEDLNTLEDEDTEKVSLKNQIDTKSTQHEDSEMSQTFYQVEAANVGEEILENPKEIEENVSLVNEEELPKNSNEIEPLCLGEEMFDKTVDEVNQGADDTLTEVLQNSHEDLHLVENAKDVEKITFVSKEVGVESTESSNSEVFDNLHLENDKPEIVNEEDVEKGEALCVNMETLESADQILNVEVTESMNQTKSDELDESDVTEGNSNLNQETYVSQEISESQKQTEVMDLEMAPFINEVVDAEVTTQSSAFIHTEAESLCVTDGMLRSVDEMADEAVTFANSDTAEFSPNVLESEGQANDDIPTDSSVSDYINQEGDLTLAIHESEIQEAPLQLEAMQYTNEDASELDLACKSIEIQMVSEKMDGELLQQDGCGTQFIELTPDESMSEQSIAIASIMNEMDGAEGEVPILSLDETVSFPELSEPLPELITEKSVNLPQEKDDLGEGLNPDSMTAEPNNDPIIEIVQPLTVDVEEGVVNTDNTTEVEEPSQSDGESLKMSTDSVHSILKIYHPEDSTVEAVQPIPEPSDLTKDDVPSTTTDYLEREIVDNLVVQGEGVDESNVTVITKADPMPCVSTGFISDSDIADGGVSSTYDTLIKEKLLETRKQEDSTDQKKVELETRPNLTEDFQSTSNLITNIVMEKLEKMHSPKITIKPIVKPSDGLGMCSPKPAILKPEDAERESFKITLKSLLKSSSESHYVPERYNTKSTRRQGTKSTEYVPSEHEKPTKITIKPMSKFDESDFHSEDRHSPKITIKPIRKPVAMEELQQSSRLTIKPIPHPIEDIEEQRPSPKITIKPIVKPSDESEDSYSKFKSKFPPELEIEERHSPKITIKPIPKPTEEYNSKLIIKPIAKYSEFENVTEERHSPKIIIKPIKPPDDIQISVEDQHGAKITIKPIPKDEIEDRSTQRLARKPMTKREEYSETSSPRITIKPIIKPQEIYERADEGPVHPFKLNIKPVVRPAESSSLSPKITIKPVPKPEPVQPFELIDFEDQIKQERIVLKIPKNRKTDSERVNKIKVKLSKDHGVAQILPTKRPSSETMESETKLLKTETPSDLSISVISNTQTEVKKESSEIKKETTEDVIDPLSEIPVFEITLESASAMNPAPKPSLPLPISVPPTPRKRGRPRKVPLEVREEFKDTKEEGSVVIETIESSRPKRSCRGTSVRATLGIKPRKPRGGGGRGRGRPPGSRSTKK